jgi:hypothetical protein
VEFALCGAGLLAASLGLMVLVQIRRYRLAGAFFLLAAVLDAAWAYVYLVS